MAALSRRQLIFPPKYGTIVIEEHMFFAVRDAPSRRRRGEGGFLRKGKEKDVGNELLQRIKAGAAGALGLVTA